MMWACDAGQTYDDVIDCLSAAAALADDDDVPAATPTTDMFAGFLVLPK